MSSNKDSNNTVQRRVKHSEDEPLPREKLPESLQKIVDNEESLMEQIYDGTYAQILSSACPKPSLIVT